MAFKHFGSAFGRSKLKLDTVVSLEQPNVAPPTTPKGPNPNRQVHKEKAEAGRHLFRSSLVGKNMSLSVDVVKNRAMSKSVSFYENSGDLKQKKLAARQQICDEILATEESYVKALNEIIEDYYKPLKVESEKEHGFISYDQVRSIFGNLETLQRIHSEHLLNSLRRDANASTSVTENSFMIALAFLEMAPYLRGYAFYAGNHMQAIDSIISLKKIKPFRKFINAIEKKRSLRGALSLESLLIQPVSEINVFIAFICNAFANLPRLLHTIYFKVQRIPRYKLLIQELLKHTSVFHDDYEPLQRCAALLADVTMDVNESIRRMENQRAVWKIQRYFQTENIVQASRVYITEIAGCTIEIIERNKMKKRKNCTCFLFKDLILFGEKHGKGDKAKYTFVFKAEIDALTNVVYKDSRVLLKRQQTFLCNILDVAKPKSLDFVKKTLEGLLNRIKTNGTRRSSFMMSLEKDKQEANLLSQVAKGTIALHTNSSNLRRNGSDPGDYAVGSRNGEVKSRRKHFWSDDK